ncbi:GerAB/ArcD/ProY family transporter [Peribacillus acanthi]|uniref:GerAB/ArcD/ProY family transporter n=1 Tax=Peribacillus acanthi TaxID=2171554 RepID=UPI000D3E3F90|nr:endospore germination permease [Peribacillus acanthi]
MHKQSISTNTNFHIILFGVVEIKNSDSITVLQLILLLMTSVGLQNHVIVIPPMIKAGGRDAWMGTILVLIITLIWCFLLLYIQKKTKRENLFEWLSGKIGRVTTYIILFSVICYLTILAGVTLRETITWIGIAFLPETPAFLLIFVLCLLAWILASTDFRTISIVNFFLLIMIVILGFFVAFSNIKFKNYTLLTPILENGYKPVLNSMVYQASGMVEILLFVFLQHKTDKPFKYKHLAIIALILTGLTMGPLMGAIVEFGPIEARKLRFPAYEQWGLVTIGHFIEHVDFLSIYQWLSGAFIRISLLLLVIRELIPLKKVAERWCIGIVILVIAGFTLLPISDFQYSDILTKNILPWTFWFIFGISIFLGAIVAIFANRERRTKNVVPEK